MQKKVAIKNALISVFYKDGLDEIVRELHRSGVVMYSTGGTASYIEALGLPVEKIEQLTDYPSILGGRVKTLHPKVFGGILARRSLQEDVAQMESYALPSFDLVMVDLYPFTETLRQTSDEAAIIEKIDIGGVSLIRAAAKNYTDVLVVSSKSDYPWLLELLQAGNGSSLEQRKQMAAKAFATTRAYDTAIAAYFDSSSITDFSSFGDAQSLRYGENPHQQAVFYGHLDSLFEQLNGKEISYNNLVDIESAVYLMEDMEQLAEGAPVCAITKHTNACGLSLGDNLSDAWDKALAADPVSAFGGVIIVNKEVDEATASRMHTLFFEVLIAPAFSAPALDILRQKKNRILLLQRQFEFPARQFKSMFDGVLVMDRNLQLSSKASARIATQVAPDDREWGDLLMAELLVKHLKSNGIALVKNRQLIAIGTGQTSRVDALQQAIAKAKIFGFSTEGAVMASEAFFPFPDCVEIAHTAGIKAAIQPGGSVKDQDSIDFCDQHQMAMVLTGIRHFKH
jgi:phosphoribosylaminoimidazolecarboxamide formyltransferase / IMP cyclohydrolase